MGELERDPGLGFVTGKTLLYDERELINETKQDLYTCGRFIPAACSSGTRGSGTGACRRRSSRPRPCMYRRHAVEAAGGFDEDYFMYCEDADLCLRMVLARLPRAVPARSARLPRLGGHDRPRLGGIPLLQRPQQP